MNRPAPHHEAESQRGGSFVEFLVALFLILVFSASLVLPQVQRNNDVVAIRQTFGVELGPRLSFSDDERKLLESRVTARLNEMYNAMTEAGKKLASAPPDKAGRLLEEYRVLRDAYERASQAAYRRNLWSPPPPAR